MSIAQSFSNPASETTLLEALIRQPAAAPRLPRVQEFQIDYGRDVEEAVSALTDELAHGVVLPRSWGARWVAIKLLENDYDISAQVQALPGGMDVVALAREQSATLAEIYGDDVELLLADRRYGFINGVVHQSMRAPSVDRLAMTERIDALVTHRWLGLPIFLGVMFVVFRLVIDVSAPFLDWVDFVITGPIANWVTVILTFLSAPAWLLSLAVDGVIAGVGGTLVFIPGLVVLYFFLALLEDSGYMSRAAFIMDRFMRMVGLHGKSFIPLVLGFGCGVPAIYATRTLTSRRDRILTAMLIPFMSCSARLPVYVVFGMAFFGARAGSVIWGLYAGGILIAMGASWLYTQTILKPDATSSFILEMPPYRRPQWRGLLIHMWENTRQFIVKAGTIILGVSVIMWMLMNLPLDAQNTRDSWYGRLSATVAPAFAPLGFGEWESSGALISGLIAKEIVVSTLSQVYAAEAGFEALAAEEASGAGASADAADRPTFMEDLGYTVIGFGAAVIDSGRILLSILPGVDLIPADEEAPSSTLSLALQRHFTTASALAFLVFVLVYVPCVAVIGAMKKEFGTRWALSSALYQTAFAWGLAFIVYRISIGIGLG